MVFDVVRAAGENHVGVGEVAPVRGHGAAAEGRREARNGRRVADAGLVVDRDRTERAGELLQKPAFFVVDLRAAENRKAFRTVDGDAVLRLLEGFVAGLLHMAGNPFDRFVPADALPVLLARTADHRIENAARVDLSLAVGCDDVAQTPEGRTLRAEAAQVHRMVRVAFDVDEFAVSGRNDRAAAAGAVAADVECFLNVRELEGLLVNGDRHRGSARKPSGNR